MSTPATRASREIRSARANRRPPSLAVTLVALAIVFALAWMFFVRSGGSAPAPVVQGIQGTYTWVPGPEAKSQEGTFSAVTGGNAGGDMQPADPGLGLRVTRSAYDADTRTETTIAGEGPGIATRTTGAWPPVWRVATHSPLDYQGLAAVVRTAVEDGDDAVGIKPLKQGDRAVWRAAMTMGGTQITLVVDQQTGIVTWCQIGEQSFTADVAWGSPPPGGTTYNVDVPAGTPEKTSPSTYRYFPSPREAGRAAGYHPLVSDLAPDGYALKAVATIHDLHAPLVWLGTEDREVPASADVREDVIAQAYTRGLNWFTVEQIGRKVRSLYGSDFDGLLQPPTGSRLSYQETTLQYGALKGETALTWYQESGPSLFVSTARRAVFVTGALTRQELIAFAEGFETVAAGAAQ